MSGSRDLRIVDNAPALFQAAADEFVSQATIAVKARGRFSVALSGGSTPKALYSLLASNYSGRVPWNQTFFFWGDERHVGPDDPESNYRMVRESLLSKVPVPAENIFRVRAENPDAALAASEYEQTLRTFFQLSPSAIPRFDLVLLGMGPDGHTASLFPGTSALQEKTRLVASTWVEKFKTDRITLTLPVIDNARTVMFLVSGADKAEMLKQVLEGTGSPELLPSKLIHPSDGKLIWLVDRAAAASLTKP